MEESYILTIDIGNTSIKYALCSRQGIVDTIVLPTSLTITEDTVGMALHGFLSLKNLPLSALKTWVISSVVPLLDPIFRKAGERYCRAEIFFVPQDITLPLKNRYGRPEEVGSDRLVTTYAARQLYKEPGLIVVDFGTATTFECVQDTNYLGGLICPGVISSLRALSTRTAKLPQIDLDTADDNLQIGTNTEESLRNGLLFGFAAMVDGLCRKLKEKLAGDIKIISTGGLGYKIKPLCPVLDEVRPDLLLEGLRMSYFNEHVNKEKKV